MIGSLRGTLLERDPGGELLIEVGGVGYRVTATPAALAAANDIGGEVFVHVHHHITEATQQLYGFADADERRSFSALLGAHGVGPALALAIISVHAPDRLRLAVATDDVDALTLVPGVGKKTAARLLIELKNRLDVPDDLGPVASGGTTAAGAGADNVAADVRDALASLGFTADEIRAATADLPADGDAEDLIRQALRDRAARR